MHKATTVPRGETNDGVPGYAARCDDCEAITFGGFPTRTAAREALNHEEAPSLSGNSAEGEKSDTNQQEGVQTMSKSTESIHDSEEGKAMWLAEHPEVSEAAPGWTDELDIEFDGDTVYATSAVDVGMHGLRQCNMLRNGKYAAGAFIIRHPKDESFAATTAREAAAYARARAMELLTIAATLEAEEARA